MKVKTGLKIKNNLYTKWAQSHVDLAMGLDFTPESGAILVKFTHLQKEDFEYTINCNNSSGEVKKGTVRIFIAPANIENKEGNSLPFNIQKKYFIELDKFVVTCKLSQNILKVNNFGIPYSE